MLQLRLPRAICQGLRNSPHWSNSLLAFGPAQHEAQIGFQRLIEPLALGKATIPDMAYLTAPLASTAAE